MTARLRNPVVLAWTGLMLATMVSWYLGDGHGDAEPATIGVLVVMYLAL